MKNKAKHVACINILVYKTRKEKILKYSEFNTELTNQITDLGIHTDIKGQKDESQNSVMKGMGEVR